MMHRRGLLGFLAVAPAIIRTPGLLMPIKPTRPTLPPIFGADTLLYDGMLIREIDDGPIEWVMMNYKSSFKMAVRGEVSRPDGSVWRHDVRLTAREPAAIEDGKAVIRRWFTESLLAESANA